MENSSGQTSCPTCSALIPATGIQFTCPFPCPRCGESLYVPTSYAKRMVRVTLPIAIISPFLFGARGLGWLLWSLLCYFPVAFVVGTVWRKALPPTLAVGDKQE